MAWRPRHRSPEQTAILEEALSLARRIGAGGLAVFDLDGCLIDNRARQIHILREYGSHHDVAGLYRVQPEHFVDWDLKHTLRLAGVSDETVRDIYPGLHEYWWRCFFSDEYLVHDHAMPGAVATVRAVRAAGMPVTYLTARYENVRRGTLGTLERFGFPLGDGVHLEMKGDPELDDDVAKADALERIRPEGPTMFFDNEPANVNAVHRRFPEAHIVFVETDHSPRPIEPEPSLPRIRGFLR